MALQPADYKFLNLNHCIHEQNICENFLFTMWWNIFGVNGKRYKKSDGEIKKLFVVWYKTWIFN